MKIIFSEL